MEKNAIKTFLILKGFSFSDPWLVLVLDFFVQSLEKICATIATTIG